MQVEQLKILDVDPSSPLFGYVRPGYTVLSINDKPVLDSIDFRFKISDDKVKIIFADPGGTETDFTFEEFLPDDIGLTFDESKVRVCKCNCIFCFVSQQPKGMRRVLYVKDEDYRLSFTHGNFVTLSNTTDEDLARIIEQRLSPVYVSVHVTDTKLRRCMLGNEKLAPIIPRLKQLAEGGITIQTQVVLCPGVNDGKYLKQTIEELADLYPAVETLAVVPVGLTKYREKLSDLRTYTPDEAGDIIDYIEVCQHQFLKEHGTRFVWPADEFYIAARRPFPKLSEYEEMNQFENGIGMAREFITKFNRRRARLKSLQSAQPNRRALFLTGHSAIPFLSDEIFPYVTNELNLKAEIQPVENKFWGKSVTVSGLLTGQDMLRHARAEIDSFDCVVVPPNCLNGDDLFLDNLTLSQFSDTLQKPVIVGSYDMAETLKEVYA